MDGSLLLFLEPWCFIYVCLNLNDFTRASYSLFSIFETRDVFTIFLNAPPPQKKLNSRLSRTSEPRREVKRPIDHWQESFDGDSVVSQSRFDAYAV